MVQKENCNMVKNQLVVIMILIADFRKMKPGRNNLKMYSNNICKNCWCGKTLKRELRRLGKVQKSNGPDMGTHWSQGVNVYVEDKVNAVKHEWKWIEVLRSATVSIIKRLYGTIVISENATFSSQLLTPPPAHCFRR